MIAEARKLHPSYQFEVCPMESLWSSEYLKPVSYNTIIFLASFHHLETREQRLQVLSEIKKYLTSGGVIYMTNWNLRDQPRYQKSHRWDGDYDIKIWEYSRYYHGFTVEELEGLFEEAEYKIVANRIFEWGRNIWSKIQMM
jgi:SAM-dependent methyltransferase